MSMTAASPAARLCPLDPATIVRTELVRPAMCGHNALLAGRIGDWTWDAVSALCGTDVLCARDPSGAPTYLSFYYYRIRGGPDFHLRTPAFGDRLHVTSRLFDFGSESVLALHRIARSSTGKPDHGNPFAVLSAGDFYASREADCLYVENFNRWIRRSDERSNRDLMRSSPAGFRHKHLPALPEAYSPRRICQRARTALTFLDHRVGRYVPAGPAFRTEYRVDPSRDLNSVRLLYFASFFSIVDRALLLMWRRMGRDDESFMDRVVVDQQLCYLGNADAGCTVKASVRRWLAAGDDAQEVFDVVLRAGDEDRLLAVCTLRLMAGAS